MKKSYKWLLIIVGVIIVLGAAFFIGDRLHLQAASDRIHSQAASDQHMEQMMQAIAADPDAVTVKDSDGHVITDAFLSDHLEELQAGEYWPAIDEIRGNRYSFSISETPKTSPFLNATP